MRQYTAKKSTTHLSRYCLQQWVRLLKERLEKEIWQIAFSAKLSVIAVCCLLTACGSPDDGTNNEVNNAPNRFFGNMETSPRFASVERNSPLTLPSDHKSHPDFQLEWWYLTFVLENETGEALGLQYTLFRFNTNDDDNTDATNDSWSNGQQWMGHASLHTINAHYFEERFASGGVGNAFVKSQPFSAVIDDWTWQGVAQELNNNSERESKPMFPSTLSFAFGQPKQVTPTTSEKEAQKPSEPTAITKEQKLNKAAVDVSLHLTASGPFVKHGERGYSQKTQDGRLRSYYYSQPFIEAQGTINVEGKVFNVTGKGWFDHEWTSHLANNQAMGWDWFSLHFDNGTKLMAFRMHATNQNEKDSENSGENHMNEIYTTASYITENGDKETLSADDISISPIQREMIKRENRSHLVPVQWKIIIPSKNIDVSVSAFKKDQWNDSVFPYYEGRVEIEGSHSGSGFMELTGY